MSVRRALARAAAAGRVVGCALGVLIGIAAASPAGGGATPADPRPADCSVLDERPGPSTPAAAVDAAAHAGERCLHDARQRGDQPAEAAALLALAEIRGLQGRWEDSLSAADAAAGVARATGDRRLLAHAETARGDANFYTARLSVAAAAFERAHALFAALGDARGEAFALKNLGITQVALGRRDLALVRLEEALERHPGGDDEGLAVSVLGNLGTIYFRLGAPRAARRAYAQALELARARGHPSETSDLLGRFAHLELELGHADAARNLFADALAAAEEAGPIAILPLLEGMASAEAEAGHREAAVTALERLITAHHAMGNAAAACLPLVGLGRLREDQRPDVALAAYRQAEALAPAAGPRCRWAALVARARLARRQGDREQAITTYLDALPALDERWRRAVSDFERGVLSRDSEPVARDLVELLVERAEARDDAADRDADLALAFAVLERARAPGLTRAIAESRLAGSRPRPGTEPGHAAGSATGRADQVGPGVELEHELRTLEQRLESTTLDDGERKRLGELLARREVELDERRRNARRAAGGRTELEPIPANRMQRLLPAGTTLVSFLVGERRSLAFVLTAERLDVVPLPARRATIEAQVEGFVDLLADGHPSGWAAVGHRLYRDLVAPWEAAPQRAAQTLVIVPDPLLRSLPFAALPRRRDGGEPLLERAAIAYAPSATALAELLAVPPAAAPASLLVLTGPGGSAAGTRPARLRALYEEDGHDLAPLAFATVEARRIAAQAGARGVVLEPSRATESSLERPALARASVLHFATHGLLSPADPRRSALLLAADPSGGDDGFLQAREIEHLRLPAELVVLSGCRTARGVPTAGAAVQSLAEAFFRAGARTVVGTLWDVEDEAAMELATAFYRQLAAGHGKGEALRRAKLERLGAGAPPRDWAGFVLLGEPAGRLTLGQPTASGWAARAWPAVPAVLALAALAGWTVARRRRTGNEGMAIRSHSPRPGDESHAAAAERRP